MYSLLNIFVRELVSELNARAETIADSVERTGTTSDFGLALTLRLVATSIERAWGRVPR